MTSMIRNPHGESVHSTAELCRCLNRPIEYVSNPLFEQQDADSRLETLRLQIAAPPPPSCSASDADIEEISVPMRLLDRRPLSRDAERYLFLRMNYLRYQASHLQQRLEEPRPNKQSIRRIAGLLDEAIRLRNNIVESNQRLVVSIAKHFADAVLPLDELIADTQLPLMRAVELFDVSRGYCFSTYASHTIRNHCGRVRTRFHRRNRRLLSFRPSDMEGMMPERGSHSEQAELERQRLIAHLLSRLIDREKVILSARFGLGEYNRPHTFLEIGRFLGLSKERVRVVAGRAIEKIQQSAEQQKLVWLAT